MASYPITSSLGPQGLSCVYYIDSGHHIRFYSAQDPIEYGKKDEQNGNKRREYVHREFIKIEGQLVTSDSDDLAAISWTDSSTVYIRLYYIDGTILKELCLDIPKSDKSSGRPWTHGDLNKLNLAARPQNYITAHINETNPVKQLKVYTFPKGSSKKPTIAWTTLGSPKWETLPEGEDL